MWGLVICIKMFTNVYLNKVLFIPCEVISLHPRRLMLSESPAVGSVHGHRVGRAVRSRRERTGSADGPRPSSADAHTPPPLVPARERGHGCCGPSSAPSPRGQSCSGPKRRTDVPAVPGWWIRQLRRGGDRRWSSLRVEEAPKAPDGEEIPRGIRGALPAPAQSWRLSVRCDSSFPTCLYFSSSCVVAMIFFLNSRSPHVEEAGSLSLVQHRT